MFILPLWACCCISWVEKSFFSNGKKGNDYCIIYFLEKENSLGGTVMLMKATTDGIEAFLLYLNF